LTKHTILFLAANPLGTDRLALDREARAIQVEFERSGHRDQFELVTRWAAEPLDLLRELRKLKPMVVHFSGHGGRSGHRPGTGPRRDVVQEMSATTRDHQRGLYFQGPDGRPRLVSTAAIRQTFGAAGKSVKVVVLNACYSDVQAEALLMHVGCIVGIRGTIRDDAARSFAIGFYGALGDCESVAAAHRHGCAAMGLEGSSDGDKPLLRVRDDIDAELLVLARPSPVTGSARTESQNAVTVFRVHCALAQLQFAAMNPGIIRLRPEQLLEAVVDGARSLGLLVGDKDSAIRALSPQALSSKILHDTEQTLPPLLAVARLAQVATIRLLYRGTSFEDVNIQEVMTLELTAKICSDEIGIPDDSFMSWHKSQFAPDANPQLIMKRLEELVRAAFR